MTGRRDNPGSGPSAIDGNTNRLTVNPFTSQGDLDAVREMNRESSSDAVRHALRVYRIVSEAIRDDVPVTIDGKRVIFL